MSYDPKSFWERGKGLTSAQASAVVLVTALLGLGIFVSEVERLRSLSLSMMDYTYLALFVLTGTLIFLWISASQNDLRLLFDWLDPERYEPPSSFKEGNLIVILAILLIGLLFASRNPVLFGSVFTAYGCFLIFVERYIVQEISVAIAKSRLRVKRDMDDERLKERAKLYSAGIEIIESYFIKRPLVLRHILVFVASLVGLGLALWWKATGSPPVGVLSNCVFSLTILASETLIGMWRSQRDRNLRSIRAELREHERGHALEPVRRNSE
jgi:hypothetical protein